MKIRIFSSALALLLVGSLTLLASPATADQVESSLVLPKQLQRIDLDDYRGRRWKLKDFQDDSIIVVAFLGTECPLAKLYAIRLQEMQDEFSNDGVRVVAIMSNRQDSLLDLQAFANRQSLSFPLLKDAGGRLADELGATRTPEIFVFDQSRRLKYQGRVDDQYGIGYVREEPRRHDLRVALQELVAGKQVQVAKTDAVGCIIGRRKKASKESSVTYGGQVAKILNQHCVSCHRDDEIAPFALTDYEEVAGWADMIAEVVREKRMPPWHADPAHGAFANARTLSDEEKQILFDWAAAGAPAGDLSSLPELPEKVSGWQLPRKPDLVFDVSPEPYVVPAEGTVRYQYFRVDPGLEKDTWIECAELKPGNRSVVHHILAFAVPKGTRRLNGERGFLVGYVPGARVEPWPAGHAKLIPAGHQLVFQVHYTPIGIETTDQSKLGFCVADESNITHEIVTTSAVQTQLKIPPHDSHHEVKAKGPGFPEGAKLLSMSPHMHVRGKAFKYSFASSRKPVLSIPQYDFNWQTTYVLDQPLPLKQGDFMVCDAVFDNSAENLSNPDPSDTVRWGDQTWDEMMIGYYHLSVPRRAGDDRSGRNEDDEKRRERSVRLGIFDALDRDNDGKITKADAPPRIHAVIDSLDSNGDGTLTRQEVESN